MEIRWEKALHDAVGKDVTIDGVECSNAPDFSFWEHYPGLEKIKEGLDDFYRIVFSIRPAEESCIRGELCLPVNDWNGRYLGTGNGGPAYVIYPEPLVAGIRGKFAVVNYDLGTGPQPDAAIKKPEKWKDYGWRANHLVAVAAKRMIEVIKGKKPDYSYFYGGSTGGQQGLAEAQRFPTDYDGIIAMVPGNNRTGLHTYFAWLMIGLIDKNGNRRFEEAEIDWLHEIAVTCLRDYGLGAPDDSFITCPAYDRQLIGKVIKRVKDTGAFTAEQLEALEKIYEGPRNPRTGEWIYCGLPVGMEMSMKTMRDTPRDLNGTFYPQHWVFGKEFDYQSFDFDKDLDYFNTQIGADVNANSADLSGFKANGGKLIMTAGMQDMVVPAQEVTHYYERVMKQMGGQEAVQSFFRYYLIPGHGHMNSDSGGVDFLGAEIDQADWTTVPSKWTAVLNDLIRWVEQGQAPEYLMATGFNQEGAIRFQRPVFAYPDYARYYSGDPLRPDSFVKEKGECNDNLAYCAERYLAY